MTTVAWDGLTLAADRQATSGGFKYKTSKLRQLANGEVLAITGTEDAGHALMKWYEEGADPAKWPTSQLKDDTWCRLIVARPRGGVVTYETQPVAVPLHEKQMAWGSGRDFAIAAMYLGQAARGAVGVACQFDTGTGCGIESFDVLQGA